MWISDSWQDFEVLDCSRGEKLERWGSFYLVRPDPQVIWSTPRQDPRYTVFGRDLFVIGSGIEVARLSGIKVRKTKFAGISA